MDRSRIDPVAHNREAWNIEVGKGNVWTIPVSSEKIAAARKGEWEIVLTPIKPVPKDWFPPLNGCRVLCLASGGGQQGPILSAAGAIVTVFDNSSHQLQQDIDVARRDGLNLFTQQGDMRNLDCFSNDAFDLIVHPVSNVFVESIQMVWNEAFRVLSPGGVIMSGFCNPLRFIFDQTQFDSGPLIVKNRIPYNSLRDLSDEEMIVLMESRGEMLQFGHTLQDQIGGQITAGFVIDGFYEDNFGKQELLDNFIDSFAATRAVKPKICA